MQKIKKKKVSVGERIYFGKKKGSFAERYFDEKKFNIENAFALYVDHSQISTAKVIISFIYLDEDTKKVTEYFTQTTLSIVASKNRGTHETKIPVKVVSEGKKLHRIRFEVLPVIDSSLYLTVSD